MPCQPDAIPPKLLAIELAVNCAAAATDVPCYVHMNLFWGLAIAQRITAADRDGRKSGVGGRLQGFLNGR